MAFNDKLKKLMGQDDTATNEDIKGRSITKCQEKNMKMKTG